MSRQRLFEAHGVRFTGSSGDQLIGYCPFSDRDDKFYVNQKTWLWDSKTANVSGNIARFLELTHQRYRRALTTELLTTLATDRGLPSAAFRPWRLGWTGRAYALAVRDPDGTVVDIRTWRPGGRMLSTPTVSVGLWNAEHLNDDPAARVYLCEGEWDAIALRWLMDQVKAPGLVVAVPGASVFKNEWIPWFAGRTVVALYDHDEAGMAADAMIAKKLRPVAQRVMFCHWPSTLPEGYDVRDWVTQRAVDERAAQACWDELNGLFFLFMRKSKASPPTPTPARRAGDPQSGPADPGTSPPPPPTAWGARAPSLADVMTVFGRWLHLDSTDPIRLMLAVVVSQAIDGPPVWMFLVGPPGSAKTATLTALNRYERIYTTSSLTTHALISGGNFRDGIDPSLIPRLDGKVMVIKDFTSILAMRDNEKDEIFGILRDAYDGKCGKVFGTGIERSYTSRFTILAAVTPRIYDLSSSHTSLGERFLKYAMGDNLVHTSERDIIRRAIQNINNESQMVHEMEDVVEQFLTRTVRVSRIPTIPEDIQRRIIYLAMFGARMRGSVTRDQYRNDIITSRPSAEVGSRLGIQLAKLAKSLALVEGRYKVTMQEYTILKKVMLDTIPQRTEDMLRHMLRACPTLDATMTAHDLAASSRYPIATVSRILQDLNVLDIVVREGTLQRFRWTLSPYIREAIQEAGLYQDAADLNRPTRVFVRVIKKRATPAAGTVARTPSGVAAPGPARVIRMRRRG